MTGAPEAQANNALKVMESVIKVRAVWPKGFR